MNRQPSGELPLLGALRTTLVDWLIQAAYPLWASHGIDPRDGGFIEVLAQSGVGLAHPRRARVHPRQIYAFAQAGAFGWPGDVDGIVRQGLRYFTGRYRRADGLFRTLVDVDGTALDERALLYDQAFALLGFAAAAKALRACGEFEAQALELRAAIERGLRPAGVAWRSCDSEVGWTEANPHMHLLEACLAWAEIGVDAGWTAWAETILELACTRFIRSDTGSLGEAFDHEGSLAPTPLGRIVEPGHQFEWAWLMMKSEACLGTHRRSVALRLIEVGELGVRHGVAVNALHQDLTIQDANARCWPQTERLKATLLAAEVTGDARYRDMARAAADSLLAYLDTPVRGLWLDVRLPNGELLDTPAPASTFYHLVGAIVALDSAVTQAGASLRSE